MIVSTALDDPLEGLDLSSMPRFVGAALDYSNGTVLDWHSHDVGQVVYAITGEMRLETTSTFVLLPPTMALWVAPGVEHRISIAGRAEMRTVYVRPDQVPELTTDCRVLFVSTLLRELILSVMPNGLSGSSDTRRTALFGLLAAELGESRAADLTVPIPADRRVRALAERTIANPESDETVEEWLAAVPASRKTIDRIFVRETGMTPSRWLRQAKLLHAVSRLSRGDAVSTIAVDLGYATPSAFGYMFRRALGVAPSRFPVPP